MLHEYFTKHWFKRFVLHIKKEGFLSFLKNGFLTLLRLFNPKHVGGLPYSYLFKKKRRLNINFIRKNLLEFDDVSIERFFNYYLNSSKINSNSIVYSFGVGGQIKFEELLVEKFNLEIFCYDPTSTNFFKNFKGSNKIKFSPIALWVKDGKEKFYLDAPKTGGSISNYFKADKENYLEVQCNNLKTLMKQNNHSHIDILKFDVEGVAIEVLTNIIDSEIYPTQIVTEFEFGEEDDLDKDQTKQYKNFEIKLTNLINRMKLIGYKCYNMPRFTHMPYSSIEVLFVKNSL